MREKRFKRVTFSLTKHDDQLVDELPLKVRSFRCNRSQIVKAALALLEAQDEKTQIALLENKKKINFACSLSMCVNSKSYPHIQ